MDKDTVVKYAPYIIVVFMFLFQFNLFATPQDLEAKHREILMEVQTMYTTKDATNDLKEQLNDLQKKIDKIYDVVTRR